MSAAQAASITDVSINLPALSQIIDVMTLQAGFNSAVVVTGTTLLGIAGGTIGVFALLRNRALMADALAHSALPGLALAFILGALSGFGGKHLWLLLAGATVSGIVGVITVQLLSRYTRLHEDAAIGAVLSCFFGFGVVLMSLIQSLGTGEEGGLTHFIFGQTAALSQQDALYMATAAALAIIASAFLLKEFRLVCFDSHFAASDGWPVSLIDMLMMTLVVLVTVIGLQAVGLLLIVAFLVIPAAGARFWTESLQRMVWYSAAIGALSGYFGAVISSLLPRFPAGAVIVLVAGAIFFISFFIAPQRGLLAIMLRQLALQIRINEDHLLREIYEVLELKVNEFDSSEHKNLFVSSSVKRDELKLSKSWSIPFMFLFSWLLRKRSLIATYGESIALTDEGYELTCQKVRNHRLWEEYLVTYADMPVTHVDYSADLVEHVLSAEIVNELEAKLNEAPESSLPPGSIHALELKQ